MTSLCLRRKLPCYCRSSFRRMETGGDYAMFVHSWYASLTSDVCCSGGEALFPFIVSPFYELIREAEVRC